MKKCTHTNIDCGCKDSYLTTPPPCPTPDDCPEAQPCSEVFDAQCIVYTGDPITCNQDTVVATGDTVAEALNDIVDYFCDNSGGQLTVVAAGDNIQVTSNTVGNVTTYTVNAACPIDVEIVRAGQDPAYFEAVVTGGTAPYTYTWSFPSTHNNDSASPNNSMYELSPIMGFPERMWAIINAGVANVFDACTSSDTGRAALLKVVVTDANGCKAKDFHLITRVSCA